MLFTIEIAGGPWDKLYDEKAIKKIKIFVLIKNLLI